MATLTVTSRGQVTFRKEVLKHLGIEPGGKIELELISGKRVTLAGKQPTGTVEDFLGILAGKTKKVATLDELEKAARVGWSRKR